MAGVAGRSGRKSATDAEKRLRVIERAWDVIEEALNDPNIDPKEKRAIAMSVVIKSMPQQVEGKTEHTFKVTHEDVEERLAWFLKPSAN